MIEQHAPVQRYPKFSFFSIDNRSYVNGNSSAGAVRAFDPATGNTFWVHGTAGPVFAALAYANNLIVDGAGSTLEVLNADSGNVLFQFKTGAPIYGAPSIAESKIFVGSTDTTIYAFGIPGGHP